MLRQADATKRAQEGSKKDGEAVFVAGFRLPESCPLTLPLNKTRALAYRGRDEKSRESAHGHCGYGQALTGYTNALRIGKA